MGHKLVQEDDIVAMNEAYLMCHTYSGAAQATGWSVSTVKRYIIPNYEHKDILNDEPKVEIGSIDEAMNYLLANSNLSCLTEQERADMKNIWRTLIL